MTDALEEYRKHLISQLPAKETMPSQPPLQVFIGYDRRQPAAFQVLCHSVWTRASLHVPITRLSIDQLKIKRRGLTEFTYSRFLVPWLCGYKGVALFLDSDQLCLGDVLELLLYPAAFPASEVFVSKNKLRFEWASVMLFNNERCTALTPDFVGDDTNPLFDFAWAKSVGELPGEWNHLVGYDQPRDNPKLIHFTQGIPCWPETAGSDYADIWTREMVHSMSTVSFHDLMGRSVHAKPVYERLLAEKSLQSKMVRDG